MEDLPVRDIEEKALSLLQGSRSFVGLNKLSARLLAGDGSGRKFYRLVLEGSKIRSAVLLNSPPGIGPKFDGDKSYSQDRAFVELCEYFPLVGIPVPRLFAHDLEKQIVVTEDVGDLPLYQILNRHNMTGQERNDQADRLSEQYGDRLVIDLFEKAVLLIKQLQSIKADNKIIAFRRYLSFENYRAEVQEFTDYFAQERGLRPSEAKQLDKIYDSISETINSFPKALSLFDFNCHNLFVSPEAELRVLDFQDACLVSPARDLVSLINDRGMDEMLGDSRHNHLYEFYKKTFAYDDGFDFVYSITLLHWDLRVSGRFVKLNRTLATDRYSQWIPSTLRRLAKTMKCMERSLHGLEDLIEISARICPEIKEALVS